MPTYLCHGFRWHRRAIRIFVILQDLEDATPDWITGRRTSNIILSEFLELYKFLPESFTQPEVAPTEVPKIDLATHQDDVHTLPPPRVPPEEDDVLINSWSPVKLLEEHDPEDLFTVCRPYAYVADYVVKVDLSVNIMDEMNKYETWTKQQEGYLAKLRDELQQDEQIQWYIVCCGDEPRDEHDDTDVEDILADDQSEATERGAASEPSERVSTPPELIERKPTPFDGLDFGFGRRSESAQLLPSPGPPPPVPPPPIPTTPRSRATTESQRASTSDKPSLDVSEPNSHEMNSHEMKRDQAPKLRKRKSLAAGLRRMFGKKETERPELPEQI